VQRFVPRFLSGRTLNRCVLHLVTSAVHRSTHTRNLDKKGLTMGEREDRLVAAPLSLLRAPRHPPIVQGTENSCGNGNRRDSDRGNASPRWQQSKSPTSRRFANCWSLLLASTMAANCVESAPIFAHSFLMNPILKLAIKTMGSGEGSASIRAKWCCLGRHRQETNFVSLVRVRRRNQHSGVVCSRQPSRSHEPSYFH